MLKGPCSQLQAVWERTVCYTIETVFFEQQGLAQNSYAA